MTEQTESTKDLADAADAPWLIMLYMAGDNNLTEDMVLALQDLEQEPPPNGDVIVAQLDPSGDGLAAQRYDFTVRKDTLAKYEKHYEVKEPNTGTVDALVDFVRFALGRAAKHRAGRLNYLLILSGHGSGTTEDFLLRDDGSLDSLTIPELGKALEQANDLIRERTKSDGTNSDRKIDIVGMDSCYMGMGEVAFEIAQHAGILIAPEGTAPAFGWPYGRLLANARNFRKDYGRPAKPIELADFVVREYVHHYSDYDRLAGRSVDLAAIDLKKIADLKVAVYGLSDALSAADKLEADKDRITLAHLYAQTYKSDQFVDLHDFCIQAYKKFNRQGPVAEACARVIEILDGDKIVDGKKVLGSIDDVIDAVDKGEPLTTRKRGCIIKSGCSGFAFQHSYGLAVHFPWAFVSSDYGELNFPKETGWYNFLRNHVNETRRAPRFPDGGAHARSALDLNGHVDVLARRRHRRAGTASLSDAARSRIVTGALDPDIATEDRLREVDCRFRQVIGLRRRDRYTGEGSKYTGEGSKYTGEGSKYTGEGSRFPDDRQRSIKNLAIPGIGIAFWPSSAPIINKGKTEEETEPVLAPTS